MCAHVYHILYPAGESSLSLLNGVIADQSARQVISVLRRRLRFARGDSSSRHSILLAYFGRLRRSTLLPTPLVLCSHRTPGQILGHVQLYLLVNHHHRHCRRSQLYWTRHLSSTSRCFRSYHPAFVRLHYPDVVQSSVSSDTAETGPRLICQ